jgi:hypothetical protein
MIHYCDVCFKEIIDPEDPRVLRTANKVLIRHVREFDRFSNIILCPEHSDQYRDQLKPHDPPLKGILRVVNRLALPRSTLGVDHGVAYVVLARAGLKDVCWIGGTKVWAGRGRQKHCESELVFITYEDESRDRMRCQKQIAHKGGRLTDALLTKHGSDIDAFIGHSVAEQMRVRKTITVE